MAVPSASMRVDDLARAADVSVDTIRYYQGRGLLPPPRREGRIVWYGDEHLARLRKIRGWAARGLSLATIGRLVSGELDSADEELAAALSAGDVDEELFGVEELSRRTEIPLPLLEAIAREGLLVPRRRDGGELFSNADVAVAAAGLRLLSAGLPLPEVLDLARRHDTAMRDIAERAVNLFDDHVRQPLRASELPSEESAEQLVAAFQTLLPATVALVTHHFQRLLLEVALQHIERVGSEPELAAVRRIDRRP